MFRLAQKQFKFLVAGGYKTECSNKERIILNPRAFVTYRILTEADNKCEITEDEFGLLVKTLEAQG